jgi:hypothetical protein
LEFNPLQLRQLAGVLLRKKIVGHWGKLKDNVQDIIKKTLLELLVKDPRYGVFLAKLVKSQCVSSMPVRKSAGEAISVIARLIVPLGQWKELLEFLFQVQ